MTTTAEAVKRDNNNHQGLVVKKTRVKGTNNRKTGNKAPLISIDKENIEYFNGKEFTHAPRRASVKLLPKSNNVTQNRLAISPSKNANKAPPPNACHQQQQQQRLIMNRTRKNLLLKKQQQPMMTNGAMSIRKGAGGERDAAMPK